jgi:hypothetical protein
MSNKSSVLSTHFLACKGYTLDEYWRQIFESCSNGKFPRGIRILDSNSIIVTSKTGKQMYQLPSVQKEEDYPALYQFMMNIFRNDLGMSSDLDQQEAWLNFESTVHEDKEEGKIETWKDVRNKSTKERLLQDYVLYIKSTHELDTAASRALLNSLRFSIVMGRINSTTVVITDGNISDITNVKINEDGSVDIEYEEESKYERSNDVKKPSIECEKYIKQCNKRGLSMMSG